MTIISLPCFTIIKYNIIFHLFLKTEKLGIHSEKVIMWSLSETPAGNQQPYIRVNGLVLTFFVFVFVFPHLHSHLRISDLKCFLFIIIIYYLLPGSVSLDPNSSEGSVNCVIYPYRLSTNVVNGDSVRLYSSLLCNSQFIMSMTMWLLSLSLFVFFVCSFACVCVILSLT
jgi:hypothetical protein